MLLLFSKVSAQRRRESKTLTLIAKQLEEMGAIVLGKTNLNVSKSVLSVSSLIDVWPIGVLQLQVRLYSYSQALLAGLIRAP